jgi:Flp pilus assembly protein TadD
VRPGNRAVVHHASLVIDRTRASRELDEASPGPGYEGMFAESATNPESRALGWTPGMTPALDPPDMAWRLVRGSDLVIQLHMTPTGKPETTRPSVGFYFSPQPPTRLAIDFKLGSKTIDIPPGEAAYIIEDTYTVPVDVELLTIYPHAHYLASDLRASAKFPDGTSTPLIWIKHWNFKWQDQYRYTRPMFLPAGTVLTMRYTYDNSDANPRNPNHPPRRVVYGPQSADEMGDLWLRFVPRNFADAEVLAASYEKNELRKRIAMTELTVKADPSDARARNELGARYVEAGRLVDAVAQLREAVRLDPRQARAHNNLATALQSQGFVNEALEHVREAVRLAPHDRDIRLSFATALDDLGQTREALAQYERALELNPDSPEAHNNLGALLASLNRLADAEPHFLEALAIRPDYADARRNLDMLRQIRAGGRPAP